MNDVLDSLPECIFVVDRSKRVLFANRSMVESCGVKDADVVGKHCSDVVSCCPTLIEKNYCPHGEVFDEGKTVNRRFDYLSPEGWKKVFDLEATPVRDSDGSIVKMAVALRDVTERGKIEEILEKYAEGLTVLYELTTVFLTTKGMEEAMKTALSNIGEYYGADFTQVLVPMPGSNELEHIAGTGWKDIEARDMRIEANARDLAGYAYTEKYPAIVVDFGTEQRFERSQLLEKHGINSGVSVPMVAGKNIIGVLCILYGEARDIDTAELWYLNVLANSLAVYIEKERSLERFEKSEAFLSSVLEGIGEGVVVVDREFRIISANKSYLSSIKVNAAELDGRHCYEVSHHFDRPCFEKGEKCPVYGVFETGGHHMAMHTHFSSDGTPIHVQTNAYPITDQNGKVVAAVETIMDVTERVLLEKDLEKRIKELEEFYDMAVGRELRMIELKEEISKLEAELSRHRP
jgi:PAS domain S-box-containing protein